MDQSQLSPQPSAGSVPPVPLYIAAQDEIFVGLDGPALRVSQPGSADRLYPLCRIGRIHTSPRADWEQTALLACAKVGIPVLFVDDDGAILARLLGRPGERDELRSRLVEFLLRPEAAGMLHYWMDQSRHRAARWAALKLGRRRVGERAAQIRQWLNRTAEGLAGAESAERTRQWLRSLAYGWMEAHLADLGLGRTTELGQVGDPPLAADLTDILYWYLEPARIGWLRRRRLAAERNDKPLRPPLHADLVRLFESRHLRVASRGREITGSLHRWLIHET